MKKSILFVLAVLFIATQTVFSQKREVRNVSTFTKISYGVPGTLYLRQGDTQKVELEGDPDVLEKIETEVNGDRLSIRSEEKWFNWNWGDDDKITVYITVKDINSLHVSGSGKLIGETPIRSGDMDLKVSGSGNLKVEVNASGEMEADVSGSGNIELKGKCQEFNSDVSGSGRVRAAVTIAENATFGISGSGKIEVSGSVKNVKTSISGSGRLMGADLETNTCNVHIAGSGDVEINVKDELTANISGSGSVAYRGNPSKVHSNSSGSGKVRKM